jgi:hypothetical protein
MTVRNAQRWGGVEMTAWTKTEERALKLLAQNIRPELVAGAVGVTPSAISQLISREDFANELATRKVTSLQSHNDRDAKYDSIEDKLIASFEQNMGLMMRPGELLRALQVVNSLKRRGVPSTETALQNTEVVQLSLPSVVVNRFEVNINNQVIKAGGQSVVTVQSHKMAELAKDVISIQLPKEVIEHGSNISNASAPSNGG